MQIKEWFGHLCRTVLRIYQQPYSHEWDVQLNQLPDRGTVVEAGVYTLTLRYDGTYYTVWTSNRWYGFGHLYRVSEEFRFSYASIVPNSEWRRPSFRTMLRLRAVHEQNRRVFRG